MRHRRIVLSCLGAVLGFALMPTSPAYAQADDDLLSGFDEPSPSAPAEQPAPEPQPEAAPEPAQPAAAEQPATETVQAAPAAAPAAEAPAQPAASTTSPATLDRIKAVPKKPILKINRVELAPFVSLSLNDAYYQHLAMGGSLVYYPHDAFAIGVGVDYLYLHAKTQNIDYVREGLTSVPGVLELPKAFGHLDFYWVPIYGKASIFDSDIMHFELYATGGAGVATAFDGRFLPAVNAGVGERVIFGDWIAFRIELRNHTFLDTQEVNSLPRSDIQNYTMLMAGLSFFIPPSFEYTFQ